MGQERGPALVLRSLIWRAAPDLCHGFMHSVSFFPGLAAINRTMHWDQGLSTSIVA